MGVCINCCMVRVCVCDLCVRASSKRRRGGALRCWLFFFFGWIKGGSLFCLSVALTRCVRKGPLDAIIALVFTS